MNHWHRTLKFHIWVVYKICAVILFCFIGLKLYSPFLTNKRKSYIGKKQQRFSHYDDICMLVTSGIFKNLLFLGQILLKLSYVPFLSFTYFNFLATWPNKLIFCAIVVLDIFIMLVKMKNSAVSNYEAIHWLADSRLKNHLGTVLKFQEKIGQENWRDKFFSCSIKLRVLKIHVSPLCW